MAKEGGSDRGGGGGSAQLSNIQQEVKEMIESGRYSSVKISPNGGYIAIEKSSYPHKSEEIEAAKHLSNNGYKVILKNEAGMKKTVEGYINGVRYEQQTPVGGSVQNFRYALGHAESKKANIAVIYTKNSTYTRKVVENGIKLFESHRKYRFQKIIVVTKDGRIHIHTHNI